MLDELNLFSFSCMKNRGEKGRQSGTRHIMQNDLLCDINTHCICGENEITEKLKDVRNVKH